jgi:hypothetical protein
MKKLRIQSRKPRLTDVGIRCTDYATSVYPRKLAITSLTIDGLSVDTVRLRIESQGVCSFVLSYWLA